MHLALQCREGWLDYSTAEDATFAATDIPQSRWWVVDAEVKEPARLNVMAHLLTEVPYQDLTSPPPELPPPPEAVDDSDVRPREQSQHDVPDVVPAV